MVTKAKKALLASLAAFLCVMLTVFGLSMSVSLSETAKAADETTTEVAEVNGVKFATLAEAIAAAKDGETVKLLADATEDVVVDKNITLDLGGKTLKGKDSGYATLSIQNGATTTVKNGSIVGSTSYYTIEITKGSNATATFEDLTATAGNTGSSMIDNWGTLTINSGVYSGGLNTVKSEEGTTLTITGGKFVSDYAPKSGITGTILVYGTTIISGGEFIQNSTSRSARVVVTGLMEGYTAITKISGGKFTNKKANIFHWTSPATPDNFEISGGIFNKSIPYYICADGFIPAKNADGTYGVKLGKYVVDVEGDGYETLAEAVAAAESGDTITLLADIANTDYTVANVINIKLAEGVTLDGNNHTLSGNVKITVASAGGVTIQNVKFKDIHNDKVIDSDSKTKYGFSDDKVGTLSAIYASNLNGSLTVMDCEFENVDWDAMQITPATGAEVVIKNNIFKVSESETVKEQLRHVHIEMAYGGGVDYEGTDISLTVTDNQFFDKNVTSIGAWWIGKGSNLALSGNYYADPDSASITLSDKSCNRENRVDLIYPARSTADVDVDDLTATVMVIKDAFNSATYSTLAEAIAAAEDGQTIKLLADCSGNGIQIKSGRFADKGLTVDFGGHTYTVGGVLVGSAGTGTNAFQLLKGNKITFQNGTIKGVSENTKPAEDTPNWHGAPAMVIQNYCDLTLKNMTVSGGDETVYTMSNNNGDVVIEDTTINAGGAKGYSYGPFAFDVCRYDTYPSVSVTVRGNSVINGNIEISGAIGEGQNRQLNVENGTFNGTFNVSGNVPANIAISGGTFTNAVPAEYCAKGFIPQDNGDGTFGVKVGTYVAKIGEAGYETLAEAIAAAKDGETVKLLADVEQNSEVSINKNITLDLNGKKIYNTKDIWHDTDPVIVSLIAIKDGAEVTVMGDGTIAAKADDCYTIDIVNGKLTIENGTFVGNISVVQVVKGKLTINGGTFSLIQKMTDGKGADRYLINCIDEEFTANNAQVAIYGGSFAGFDPNVSPEAKVDGKVPSFAAPGVGITKNEDGSFTAKANKAAQILDSDGNSVAAYATLEEAVNAAVAGQTVMLLKSVDGNFVIEAGKDFTLDLNGFTLNGGTGNKNAAILNNGTLVITDSSAAKTGTIKRDDNGIVGETSYYVIRNLGTMTIEQANVINNSGYRKTNPSGSMVGSSLICNGDGDNNEKASLTINGGKFTQTNFLAIKNGVNGTLVVNGGEITSNHSAIQNWYSATITGGTIKGQLWTDAWTEGGSVGNTVIDGNVDYEGEIVMDVTGSSIKPTLTVNGGNLSVTNWRITTACAELGGKPAISGGTFSSEVNKDYLAKGYRLTKTGDSYSATEKYIASSTVSLGVDLSFKYEMVKGKSVNRVVASYYKVNETEATEYELANVTIDGVVYYVFNGITPQMIDRKISVNVYVGNTVIYDVVEYSILDNLGAVLKKELGSKQDVTRQLVASLAYYGKAAMEYVKYDSSAVQKFIDDNKLSPLTAEIKDGVVAEYDSNETKIARISVQFADTNKVLVGVDEKVFDNYNYTIMVNGQEITSIDWQTGVVSGYNVYVSEGFAARYITDANKYVEVEVLDKNNNNNRVQYVKYNVAGYCMMMKDNATMGALATATYYYGVAAANYAA